MRFKNINYILLFLTVLSLVPLAALVHPGLPLTHDGQDHVARIANFYQSLSEGNVFPRWAGNLNWGYGHPVMMFLYPLPSYIASIFHFFGFSLVDSVKIVFALAFVLSGTFMFIWLREITDDMAAFAGATMYLFAPYRFIDLYVRGAIGEHVAFIFPPLVCYFLLKLSSVKKFSSLYLTGAALSLAGLILAHNAITIMFLPFFVLYALYLIYNSTDKRKIVINILCALFLGIGLSAFFLIPAFFEGKYTLRDIVTGGEVLKRFIKFEQLFYGDWNYGGTGSFTVQIGIAAIVALFLSPVAGFIYYKKNNKHLLLMLITLVCLLASLFLMLPVSEPVWKLITTLQKFQFPWRFLSVTVFSAAVLGALVMFSLDKKMKTIGVISLILFSFFINRHYWQPKDYLHKPESFYTSVYKGTTDTGESSPIWSVRFMEKLPEAHAEVIQGQAEIKTILRSSTHHKYEVNSEFGIRMRENTLFFPGWKVYVDGKEYKGIQFQDPQNRGLMTFYVLQGKHIVDVVFEDTRLRQISNMVTLFSALCLGLLIFYPKLRSRKTK